MFEKRKERRVRDTEVSKKVFSEEARDTKRSVSKGNWDNEKTYSQNDRKENEKVRKKRDKRSRQGLFRAPIKVMLLWERGEATKRAKACMRNMKAERKGVCFDEVKRRRAHGECLGIRSRRRT